jgi:excinuclease ABC subunit A
VKLHPTSHTAKALREYDGALGAGEAVDALCGAGARGAILRPPNAIQIVNAHEHNLKNLSVDIPHNKFSVITGVSGSGKSTLAFDILFNEGQRRYLESLNAYARSIVQPAGRPEVDAVYGIPPTVAIEQRLSRGGRKSTVGTTTEVWHFLRLLYVKLGIQHCVNDGAEVRPQNPDSIVAQIMKRYRGQHVGLLAPLVIEPQGRLHRAGRLGAAARLHPPARGRQLPAHHRLPAHRPLQGAHHRAAGVRPGRHAGQRGPAARKLAEALEHGKGVLHVLAPLDGLKERLLDGLGKHDDIGKVEVFSTLRACPVCAPATPNWTRGCSRTTASTAGVPTAWAPASSSRASSARRSTTRCRTRTRAASRPSPSRRSRTWPTRPAPPATARG